MFLIQADTIRKFKVVLAWAEIVVLRRYGNGSTSLSLEYVNRVKTVNFAIYIVDRKATTCI